MDEETINLNTWKRRNDKVLDPEIDYSKNKSVHSINSCYFILGLTFIVLVSSLAKFRIYQLPNHTDSNEFSAERAWKDLVIFNDIGQKVSGTYSNEVEAVNAVKKSIIQIQNTAHANQNVTLDHQIVSGAVYIPFKPEGMVCGYRSVQNLVVRLAGENDNALMLNCHFDSVPGSPGASDDSANCAIMLEILRKLSQSSTKNKHSVIFLFNGAEETGLRASHGFITKQQWRKDIKAFINLEAAGSGGKEMLFQTGPGHTWIVDHYKKVKYPNAHAAGEEIFQSNLIPSDTDFRIFRDYGNIPGMDFAHAKAGYRYHTKFDSIDYITPNVLQRTGENIMTLVQSIANSIELSDTSKYSKTSSAVYFDYLGFFFITYTTTTGKIINFAIVLLTVSLSFLSLTKATVHIHSKRIVTETLLGFLSMVLGTGFSGLVCFIIAFVLDQMDYSMSWYRSTFLAPLIYGTASLISQIAVYNLVEFSLANKKTPISLGLKVQARLNGVNLFWSVIVLGLTVAGYRVGYLFMIILLINLVGNIVNFVCQLHNSVHNWLYAHMIGQFFIIFWASSFFHVVIDLFIPITGRSGSNKNPDTTIGAICCIMTLFMCSYFIPLTQLLKKYVVMFLTLISLFLVGIILAISTNIGFPYQNELTGNPTVQRQTITHTMRLFYNLDGELRRADGGFMFVKWDRHSKKTIEGMVIPDIPNQIQDICESELFCGMPLTSSRLLAHGGMWMSGSSPKVPSPAVVESHSIEIKTPILVQYSFTISANSSLSSVFFRTKNGAILHAWNFSEDVPAAINNTYFISITNGINVESLVFNLTLKTATENFVGSLLDITLVSIDYDKQSEYTDDFKKILNRVPEWAYAVHSVAAVIAYEF
ncbi:unnamed protein product [Diamesa serratosioi]